MTARISEEELAAIVRPILATRPDNSASYADLRVLIPQHVFLSKDDREFLPERGEEAWMQILRNLVAHRVDGFEPCIDGTAGIRLADGHDGDGTKP